MSDVSKHEPPAGGIDAMPANGGGDGLPPVEPVLLDGYDDDELDAAELDEDAVLLGPVAEDGYHVPDVDLARIEARQDAIEEYQDRYEAARVRRKVSAATAGSAIAGAIPAILAAVEALNLPPDVQPFVLAAASVLGAFLGGYAVPERPSRTAAGPA